MYPCYSSMFDKCAAHTFESSKRMKYWAKKSDKLHARDYQRKFQRISYGTPKNARTYLPDREIKHTFSHAMS